MLRFARSLLAALTLLALVIGLPVLLARFGSWPLRSVPTVDQLRDAPGQALTDHAVFAILTVAAWLTWAAFTVTVILELVAALRGASYPRLPYLAPLQNSARQLVTSLLMTATLTGPLASHRVVAAPALPRLDIAVRRPVATVIHEDPPPVTPGEESLPAATVPAGDLPTIRVGRGDSPWSLAERHLGDGLRWREIWDLNRGIAQADGRAWVVEDQIDIGWQLRLPADAIDLPTPPLPSADEPDSPAGSPREHVVVAGDTLREIAEAELGDSERYPEIVEASRAIEQPGGARLTDPDLILPGWTLRLPADHPSPAVPDPAGAPADVPHANGSAPATTTTAAPPATTAPPSTEVPSTTTAPATSRPASSSSTRSTVDGADPEGPGRDRSAPAGRESGSVLAALGTALAGVTGATVLATGLAALIRRRRRGRSTHRLARATSETELAIVRASDVPLVRWAGQSLAAMAASLDPRHLAGVPVAVELSDQTGIELLWDTPQPDAPEPWQATDGGWAWRLAYDPDAPVPPDEHPSPLPALVTVGRRDGRQLLVNLEAFGSLAVDGDPIAAQSLTRSMALELAASEDLADAWLTLAGIQPGVCAGLERVESTTVYDALHQLATTEGSVAGMLGDAATSFAVRAGTRGTHIEAAVVMVERAAAEDPDRVETAAGQAVPHQGAALVVLGHCPTAAAQLTVDPDGSAHLEPLGIDFDAVGVPTETTELIEDLLAASSGLGDEGQPADGDREVPEPGLGDLITPGEGSGPADLAAEASNDEAGASAATASVAGPTVIDLRAVDHDLEGDQRPPATARNGKRLQPADEPLDLILHPRLLVRVLGRPQVPDRPELGRREIVLTAYLACHGGPVSTSGVQDAIWNGRAVESKTLWNLIARTRRGLGTFDDGTPVLPPADRLKSTIRLAPGATSDLGVLRASYERALDSSSAEAITLLHDALELVEGPPFDAPGFDWAHHTHQYVAEASALIEQAADLLARLAQADGDTDLARHAVVQGLRALPGNEVLYRRRMQLEADAGNLAGVKAAFRELTTLLDDLDSEPSDGTSALHDRLLHGGHR